MTKKPYKYKKEICIVTGEKLVVKTDKDGNYLDTYSVDKLERKKDTEADYDKIKAEFDK